MPRKRMNPRRPNRRRRVYRNRYRKNGPARPMRALRTNYRAVNKYCFVRETLPKTALLGIIGGSGSDPNLGYMNFDNFKMSDLPDWSELQALFQTYTIDKIITYLIPTFENSQSLAGAGLGYDSEQLMITRVNTQYRTDDFPLTGDANAMRAKLA